MFCNLGGKKWNKPTYCFGDGILFLRQQLSHATVHSCLLPKHTKKRVDFFFYHACYIPRLISFEI